MPYISGDRKVIDEAVEKLMVAIFLSTGGDIVGGKWLGSLNYAITTLLMQFPHGSYTELLDLIGTVEAVKLELYRRAVAPYEDKKIVENGDVYFLGV